MVGQSSFGQNETNGGDWTNEEIEDMCDFLSELFQREITSFGTDENGNITSVSGPDGNGGTQNGFVGFESSNDGTTSFSYTPSSDTSSTGSSLPGSIPHESTNGSSSSGSSSSGSSFSGSFWSGGGLPANPSSCDTCDSSDDSSNYVTSSENIPTYFSSGTSTTNYNSGDSNNYTGSTSSNCPNFYGAVAKLRMTQSEFENVVIEKINSGTTISSITKVNIDYNGIRYEGSLTKFVSADGKDVYYYFTPSTDSALYSTSKQYLIPASLSTYITHYQNYIPNGTFPPLDNNGLPTGSYKMTQNNNGIAYVNLSFDPDNQILNPITTIGSDLATENSEFSESTSSITSYDFENGKDNIFNANGRPLRSGDPGNHVKIEINGRLYKPSGLVLTTGSFSALNKIAAFYAQSQGFSGIVKTIYSTAQNQEDDAAASYSNGVLKIWGSAFASGTFDNVHDFKSILGHEILHWKDPKSDTREYQYIDHANTYLKQSQDDDFKNTSKKLKYSVAFGYAKRVFNSHLNGEISRDDEFKKINDFNTIHSGQINIEYKSLNGNGSVIITIQGETYIEQTLTRLTSPHD